MKKVKVEWLQEGGIQLNGIVALRKKGEEDILDEKAAKGLAVCGLVKIVGTPRNIPKVGQVFLHKKLENKIETENENDVNDFFIGS